MFSMATPLFTLTLQNKTGHNSKSRGELSTYISSGVIFNWPTASACCFPSAITVTTCPADSPGVIFAPFDVNPGHIMFAPARTKVMAPLSTCISGQMKGSARGQSKCEVKLKDLKHECKVY